MTQATAYPSRLVRGGWLVTGLSLLAASGLIAWLAVDFTYGTPMDLRPIPALVATLMAAGLIYLAALALLPHTAPSRQLLWWILAIGAGMWLIMGCAQPILEDDFYRYLWDGAITAHGINPYTVIPANAQSGAESAWVSLLADEAGIVLERVNHPALSTIYPPVTQGIFALAHWIAPWRIAGLQMLYFGVDCLALLLLIRLLRHAGMSDLYAALYWWNPLIVKETFNGLHMDILLVPCILAAVFLVVKRRPVLASAVLALAVGVKLWPVLLLPVVLATCRRDPQTLAAATAVFAGLAALLLLPMYPIASATADSGLIEYGARWEMNDALFMVFPWLLGHAADIAGLSPSPAALHRAGKFAVMLVLGALVLWIGRSITRRAVTDNAAARQWLAGRIGILVAALFLLSPTQFPWYYIWVLPLLPVVPGTALRWLTLMLPLYYLRFYFEARGQGAFFHNRIVWLEFAPIWLLLLHDWQARASKTRHPT